MFCKRVQNRQPSIIGLFAILFYLAEAIISTNHMVLYDLPLWTLKSERWTLNGQQWTMNICRDSFYELAKSSDKLTIVLVVSGSNYLLLFTIVQINK